MKTQKKNPESILLQNIVLQQNPLIPLDIQNWTNAIRAAENIYNPQYVSLFNIYDSIMYDPFLTGVMNKRIKSIINKELRFLDHKGHEVDTMDEFCNSKKLIDLCEKFLLAEYYGFVGIEFLPSATLDYNIIPIRHIRPLTKMIAFTQYGMGDVSYQDNKNIMVIQDNDPLGILKKAAPYVIYKRNAQADWSQFLENFGMPITTAKYNAYDQETRAQLEDIFKNANGSNKQFIIPKEAELNFEDPTSSNPTGEMQNRFIDKMDEQIAILILGATETVISSKTSGYAQAETHAHQQLEYQKSDRRKLLAILNSPQFLDILKSYGLASQGYFDFEEELDLQEQKTKAKIYQIVSSFMPLDPAFIKDQLGIPQDANTTTQDNTKGDKNNTPTSSANDTDDADIATALYYNPAKKNIFSQLADLFMKAPKKRG